MELKNTQSDKKRDSFQIRLSRIMNKKIWRQNSTYYQVTKLYY